MNRINHTAAAVIVHGLDDALAAAAAASALGRPLTLISAPGAGAYAGAGWFRAVLDRARAAHPGLALSGALDCADHPGMAMAALRAGVKTLVFTGDPEVAEKLSAMASALGATVHADRPAAFDPRGETDKEAACRAWLAGRR